MPSEPTDPGARPAPPEIARRAEAAFGAPVETITAPGGAERSSVRVHFADRTVIATHRRDPARREMERQVLTTLSEAGAPVPALLAEDDTLLFQEDLGSARLSRALAKLSGQRRAALARQAFQSLETLRRIADETGLAARLPALALAPDWLGPFTETPARLCDHLGIAAPRLDLPALRDGLMALPRAFVKWDARPGNGALAPDGTVVWYDWEHCGRRGGVEDAAFLAGDEFWPLAPGETLACYRAAQDSTAPDAERLFSRFVTLQTVARLALIAKRQAKSGWIESETAMRYDRIGTAPALVQRLARHGAAWATHDPLTAPLADWIPTAAETLLRDPDSSV